MSFFIMKFAIATLALATSLILTTGEELPPSIQPSIEGIKGGEHGGTISSGQGLDLVFVSSVLGLGDGNTNRVFVPGDSLDTRLRLEREERARLLEQKRRETIARESVRGGSYTGTGRGVEVIGYSTENCVAYAKRVTGISKSIGNGGRRGVQGTVPIVGAIGVEKTISHAFVVREIKENGVIAEEANYIKGRIDRRFVYFKDIIGYIYD